MSEVNSDFYSSGTLLDGGCLASQSFQHVGSHSSSLSYYEKSFYRCFSGLDAQGSAITAFKPLAAQRCVLHKQRFPSSVCQVVAGLTQVSMTKFTSNGARNGLVGALK